MAQIIPQGKMKCGLFCFRSLHQFPEVFCIGMKVGEGQEGEGLSFGGGRAETPQPLFRKRRVHHRKQGAQAIFVFRIRFKVRQLGGMYFPARQDAAFACAPGAAEILLAPMASVFHEGRDAPRRFPGDADGVHFRERQVWAVNTLVGGCLPGGSLGFELAPLHCLKEGFSHAKRCNLFIGAHQEFAEILDLMVPLVQGAPYGVLISFRGIAADVEGQSAVQEPQHIHLKADFGAPAGAVFKDAVIPEVISAGTVESRA